MIVFVEHSVLDDPLLAGAPAWANLESKVQTFTDGKDDLTDKIDFIVCLGGDGTLLYASSLFQVGAHAGAGRETRWTPVRHRRRYIRSQIRRIYHITSDHITNQTRTGLGWHQLTNVYRVLGNGSEAGSTSYVHRMFSSPRHTLCSVPYHLRL